MERGIPERETAAGHRLPEQVVVVGFGAAGTSAVMALREAGFEGSIVVVTDGDPNPYSPVLTSYSVSGRIEREHCFIWSDLDLSTLVDDMHAHSGIVSIDAGAHEVTLVDGSRIGYSKLLIATGAHPVAPGFPETCRYCPLMLRTMEDADLLRRALLSPSCKRVLVSGTSMVGLKALEACLDRGVVVVLLGRSRHIMRSAARPLVAKRFEELLVERGVRLRLAQSVSDVDDETVSAGCTVTFDCGDSEHFDEVILAQGTKPNLGFTCEGLEIDQGLSVDEFRRTNLPDVYAAGDVAQAVDVGTGERRVIGLWQNAVQQGRCAGRAMAAELLDLANPLPFPGSLASNTIHVRDILFASAGSLEEGEGRSLEMSKADDGTMRVFVYEGRGDDRRLVGINILATTSSKGGSNLLDCEIGKYRRAILNACLK